MANDDPIAAAQNLATASKILLDAAKAFSAGMATLGDSAQGTTRKAGDLEKVFAKWAVKLTKSTDDLDKCADSFEKAGGNIATMKDALAQANNANRESETELARIQSTLADFSKQVGVTREDINKLREAYLKMGFDVRTEAEKNSDWIAAKSETAVTSAAGKMKSVLGNLVPPGMEKLGIWGVILGTAIGVEQYAQTTAAGILAVWQQLSPQLMTGLPGEKPWSYGGAGIDFDTMQKTLGAMYQTPGWQMLMSQEEMGAMAQQAGVYVMGKGGGIDVFKNIMEVTKQADYLMGKEFGSTLWRINNLMLDFGLSADQASGSVANLAGLFAGRFTQGAGLMAQITFDMSQRLGALGTNAKQVGATLADFTANAQAMGGGLEVASKATEGLYGFFRGASPAFQAIMGSYLPGGGGAPSLESMMAYQQALMLPRNKFQEFIPAMLTGIAGRFLNPTQQSEREMMFALEKVAGLPPETAMILAHKVHEGGIAGIAEGLKPGSEDLEKIVNELQPKELEQLLIDKIPAFEQLLKNFIALLMRDVSLITETLTLMLYALTHPGAMMKRGGAIWGKYAEFAGADINAMNEIINAMPEALKKLFPGLRLWKDLDVMGAPPTPEKEYTPEPKWKSLFFLSSPEAYYNASQMVEWARHDAYGAAAEEYYNASKVVGAAGRAGATMLLDAQKQGGALQLSIVLTPAMIYQVIKLLYEEQNR